MSERIRLLQGFLKGRGFDLGTSGPTHDGVDGDLGNPDTSKTVLALLQHCGVSPVGPGVAGAGSAIVIPQGQPGADPLTFRAAMELIGHESMVLEWYKDSVGVGTWGIGVTDRSGHAVARYKDLPQTVKHVLEVYIWLLRNRYIPDVLAEFAGHPLTEAQFAAALSFHYNTGAIRRASWVDLWLAGNVAGARAAFMEWDRPASIIERRGKERDLFFDGKWSQDGKATIWPVRKPSYSPDWAHPRRVDVSADLTAALAGA